MAALPPLSQESQDTSVCPGEEPRKFDSTGMFHWCPSRPLIEARMVSANLALVVGMLNVRVKVAVNTVV